MLRGYLANAEKVRVRGAEFDGNARVNRSLTIYGAVAYTDGKYVSFPDAPPPLEDTGGPQVKDISGSVLPGLSKWALSVGGEVRQSPHDLRPVASELFGALDTSYRSSFSSSASASRYLIVDGYGAAQRPPRRPLVRTGGASRCGHATCSTRTTTSSSPPRRATPGSTSASPAIATDRRADDGGLADSW